MFLVCFQLLNDLVAVRVCHVFCVRLACILLNKKQLNHLVPKAGGSAPANPILLLRTTEEVSDECYLLFLREGSGVL